MRGRAGAPLPQQLASFQRKQGEHLQKRVPLLKQGEGEGTVAAVEEFPNAILFAACTSGTLPQDAVQGFYPNTTVARQVGLEMGMGPR